MPTAPPSTKEPTAASTALRRRRGAGAAAAGEVAAGTCGGDDGTAPNGDGVRGWEPPGWMRGEGRGPAGGTGEEPAGGTEGDSNERARWLGSAGRGSGRRDWAGREGTTGVPAPGREDGANGEAAGAAASPRMAGLWVAGPGAAGLGAAGPGTAGELTGGAAGGVFRALATTLSSPGRSAARSPPLLGSASGRRSEGGFGEGIVLVSLESPVVGSTFRSLSLFYDRQPKVEAKRFPGPRTITPPRWPRPPDRWRSASAHCTARRRGEGPQPCPPPRAASRPRRLGDSPR